MLPYQPWDKPIEVALLAEGVDRNNLMQGLMDGLPTSPSSRRAWIEIYPRWLVGRGDRVALLAEGVDRNHTPVTVRPSRLRRPPRGGRG